MPYPNPNVPVTLGFGYKANVRTAVSYYDFAVDGGAVSTIALRGDKLPANAYILDTKVIVQTVPTSGGAATGALGWTAPGDVLAATVVSGAPWSSLGAKNAAFSAVTGDGTALDFGIAVAALTAGKFVVITEYLVLSA
jgi:hypothetical protein